jgi:glycosyltransferase involved in cell wall biosynthesis
MRLLILHQAYVFGGAERTTSNLLTHLNRDRVRHITLASPEPLRHLLPQDFDQFIDTRAHVRHGWFPHPSQLMADVRGCASLLSQAQPDLILGMMHYSAAVAVLGARLARLPAQTVGSYRGPAYEHIRRYEHGLNRKVYLHGVIGMTARLADRMIVPSHGTARELRRRFLGVPRRTVVIPNGIDSASVRVAAQEPAPGLERLPAELPLLCVAARLSPEKDMTRLLEVFRRLQSIRPCALALVGDGPDRSTLQDQVAAWGLSERVAFVGHRDNVYPYMRRADLYVHTCQFEGFGYTMLEAMACGTPMVATDCPYGPREVLDGGRYGLLVPPDDTEALASAVGALLADPPRRRELSMLGLERAEQLSIERMTFRYETVFNELVPAHRTRARPDHSG